MTAPALRIYGSLFLSDPPPFVMQLDGKKVGWGHTVSRKGGYLDGGFTLVGDIQVLQGIFYTWLGYHIEERSGKETWEGFVHEMVLHHKGASRRRSLGGVRNAIRAKHSGLLYNTGFENPGDDTFAYWIESVGGSDTITAETTADYVGSGEQSARIENVNSGDTYLYQEVAVLPHESYRLTFSNRGDDSQYGRYAVQDNSNVNWIVPVASTEHFGDTYRKITVEFVAPEGCELIRVYLFAPGSAGIAWYDDVEVVHINAEGQVLPNYTDWATNAQSIARYGRRELIVDAGDVPPAEAALFRDLRLQKAAWPRTGKPKFSGSGKKDVTSLDVQCVGYWATGFFKYLTVSTNGDVAGRSATLEAILSTDCDWLRAGKITSNTGNTKLKTERDLRAGEAIAQIVDEGSEANLWRFLVGNGRLCVYEPVAATPAYYRRDGKYFSSVGGRLEADAMQLQPGVWVRDVDYPMLRTAYDSLAVDARDFIVDEWDVTAEGDIQPQAYDDDTE